MVPKLAGEGAMPLPKPASHAELQVRRQIRSSLRRGVNSPFNLGVVLFFQSRVSRSRFVKSLSKVLISSMFSILNRTRSGLISNRVFVNPQFIAFSWSFRSRSVEITSTALVNQPIACVGENNQSSFWILCVLTATACCVSTGFADKESSISLFDTSDKSFSATATSHPSAANEKCVGSRKFLVTAWREYVLRQESIHCSIVHDEYMGNQLFRLIRYKRFCKAALAAQIAAGPLFAPVDMSAFESKYKDPSSIKWTVNITSEKFVELMLMRIPTKESIVNTRLILKNYPAASVAGQDILDIRFKLWKDMGDIRFLILAIGNAVAFKKTFSLLLMLFG